MSGIQDQQKCYSIATLHVTLNYGISYKAKYVGSS